MSSKVDFVEPASYEQVEQTLSNGSRSGEVTREAAFRFDKEAGRDTEVQLEEKRNSTSAGECSQSTRSLPQKSTVPSYAEITHRKQHNSPKNADQGQESVNKSGQTSDKSGESVERIGVSSTQDSKAGAGGQSSSGILVGEALIESSSSKAALLESSALSPPAHNRDSKQTAKGDDGDMRSSGPPRVIHAHISTSQTNTRPSPGSKSSTSLRRGKWTMEEEAYVARVIQDFNSGFLNAPAGTTLRSYLSEKLQCDPMRITKKFTGDACIGKRVFHPAVRSAANAASIDKAQAELDALERRWRRRLEMQQRESAKKAAASAAAANSPSQGRGQGIVQGVPLALLGGSTASSHSVPNTGDRLQQHAVAQAASWLDRANAILKGSKTSAFAATGETARSADTESKGEAFDAMPSNEIENQMKEVQRLIYEGPTIKKATAGLQSSSQSESICSDSSDPEPADKRMRTSASAHSGAEDAEALVGFLRSVRAAASQESN